MKLLTISSVMLILMSGHLSADNHSTTNDKITLILNASSEVLVKGFIAPIEYASSDFHIKWDALANFRVAEPEKSYSTSVFRAFLPSEAVSVGDVWQIEEAGIPTLLRQLHPNPILDMHINAGDSRGLWACLRAYNDEFAKIVFRIHAEFKLEDGWFTPSQFTGNMIINRTQETVVFFQMYVPKGTLNFDVNWKKYKNSIFTAAGYCPRMELRTEIQGIVADIEFVKSIPQEEAEQKLSLRFYKSQQINWVSLEEALKMAPAQQKFVHVISINGPLADESC